MCPSITRSSTIAVVNTNAPPAIRPNLAPVDNPTTSPTPGILSETLGFTPPRNAVPQLGQTVSSSGTRAEQLLHGHVGAGLSTIAVATGAATGTGAGVAGTTGAAVTGWEGTGAESTGADSTGAVTAAASGGVKGSGALGSGMLGVGTAGCWRS
jgi:hypothetical protein